MVKGGLAMGKPMIAPHRDALEKVEIYYIFPPSCSVVVAY